MPSRRFRHLTALVTVLVFLFSAVCPSAVLASGGEILFLDENENPEASDNNNPGTEEIPPDESSDEIPGDDPGTGEILFLQDDPAGSPESTDTQTDPPKDPESPDDATEITLLQDDSSDELTPAGSPETPAEPEAGESGTVPENAGSPDEPDGSDQPSRGASEEPGDEEPQGDSVDSAIVMKKVTGASSGDSEGFMNGDEIEADIRFASGQELDELVLTIRPVNLDLTAFRMSAFENAGDAVYSVFKSFSVTWVDDDGHSHTETEAMPLTENHSAADRLTVSGLDREYAAFSGARAGAEAEFTGEFRIVFSNVNEIAGTITAVGIINSPDMENASISVRCAYSKGTVSDGESIGNAGFEYREPEEDAEDPPAEEEAGEETGSDTPDTGENSNPDEGEDPEEPGGDVSGEDESGDGPDSEDPGDDEPGDNKPDEDPDSGDPGDDEPGDEEPGDEEPDQNEPGNNDPGDEEPDNEPGGEEPGTGEPGEEEPDDKSGSDDPGEEEPPEEPDVPEETQILSFSALEFMPDEIEGVPGNNLVWSLGNYVLADDPSGSAGNVRFTIKPVTADTQVRILFSGSVSSYKIVAVTSDGVATVLEQTGSDPTIVDFDSTLLPAADEESDEEDVRKPGTLPEDTQFIWISADEPSSGFEVDEFTLTLPLPDSFESFEYTADTVVSGLSGAVIASGSNTGRIVPGVPVVSLSLSASAAEVMTGDEVTYSLGFTSETATVYPSSVISMSLPESFSPKLLTPGIWEGYDGRIEISTVDLEGRRTSVITVDSGTAAAVSLTGEPLSRVELIPLSPLTGEERLSGVTLTGSFISGGEAYAYTQFAGTVTELYTHTEASTPVLVIVKEPSVTPPPATTEPDPTPTPTPEPTPTPTPEPTPEPTPAPTPESYDPVYPPSANTPEPTPTEVPLSVDTPSIYANASSIAYGDSGVFYFRNLSASGMKSAYYYVLHIMIPAGVQVSSLDIPDFGSPVRVSLVYDSGSADLGTYTNGETVSLTERQGTSLRYIAFQIHGAESVSVNRDVSLMLKNISARDRVATLQVILSVRDAKTAVIEQHYDKYNIALAGPRTQDKDTSDPSPQAVTVTASSGKKNIAAKTVYPKLLRLSSIRAEAVQISPAYAPAPLLIRPSGMSVIRRYPAVPESSRTFARARLIHIRTTRRLTARLMISSAFPLKLLRYFRGMLESKG